MGRIVQYPKSTPCPQKLEWAENLGEYPYWVPIEVGYPSDGEYVMVTLSNGAITIAYITYFEHDIDIDSLRIIGQRYKLGFVLLDEEIYGPNYGTEPSGEDVVAWAYLPLPYKLQK